MIKKITESIDANILPIIVFVLAVLASALISTSVQATINCAGHLPNSYFERIENNQPFAGKLVNKTDDIQQLQDLNGKILLDNLTDSYILMDTYLVAKKQGKYGVVNAAGETLIAFEYDDIHTEPDIATSFIVSVQSSDGNTKQGIINRHGDWVYPLDTVTIEHAHYGSDDDQDYFMIADSKGRTGLLDDRGFWAVLPQYTAIQLLNACTGKPLYLQVSSKDRTALIDKNSEIIIPFAVNQHIEIFNQTEPLLFLQSRLADGTDDSTATHMGEDIQAHIVSAQLIDSTGQSITASETPIRKLLYHQLYTFTQAGKIGLLNRQGNIVLTPQFDHYRDDADEVWFKKNGKMLRLESLLADVALANTNTRACLQFERYDLNGLKMAKSCHTASNN